MVKFSIEGLELVDRKKLENKEESELQKVSLVMEKPRNSPKRLVKARIS